MTAWRLSRNQPFGRTLGILYMVGIDRSDNIATMIQYGLKMIERERAR